MANNTAKIKEVEDKIRDLINQVEIYNEEEIEPGEGKKVEDDAAEDILEKLREIAKLVAKTK